MRPYCAKSPLAAPHLTLLAASALTLAACGAGDETARDLPLAADFPEVYRVGGQDAPDWAQFTGRGPVGFDGAGNLYILDPFAPHVVVIDPQGELVRTIGRAGVGPGEFRFPYHLAVWRDGRLAVSDIARGAILVFGPGGEFARSVATGTLPELIRPDPNADALYAQGSSGEGDGMDDFSIGRLDLTADDVVSDVVLRAWRAPREDPPGEVSADDFLDSSGNVSAARMLMIGGALDGVFFEPTLRWDILADGRVAYADSSAYAIRIVTPGGSEVEVLMRSIPPEAVTDGLRAAAIEREIGRYTELLEDQGGMTREFREGIEERGFYPEVPVIREIRSTWQGGLWVRRTAAEPWDDQGPVDVFGPDRQYLGTFAAGTATMPEAFGPDGLVAYWELDELDVATIVVKKLTEELR